MEAPELSASFCSWCQQLDDSLLDAERDDIPATGKPIVIIGHRVRNTECTVCRFFLAHSAKYKKRYKLHIRLFDRIQQPLLNSPMFTPKRFLSVIRQNKRLRYDSAIKEEIIHEGIIMFAPRQDSITSEISLLNPARIDYRQLQSSMAHCKETHRICRRRVDCDYDLPYIKLIDCTDCRIVRGDPGMVYLALSYVWGQATKPQQTGNSTTKKQQPDTKFSFESVPLTVRDAILVVRNLGMKYLWVDQYCINQDDDQEKELMIGRMDEIYEHAEATIVAVYGENAECGLPGVSIPRIPQPRLQTSCWQFISSCPPIKTVINRSIWATRGWTYQEARLSRRCLFFTEHQVYLVCQHATYSEALHTKSQDDWISILLNSSRLDHTLFGHSVKIGGALFWDRCVFSQKRLTYGNDILNAFRGILRRSPFVSFWGVPIIPLPARMDANIGFALGLLWCRRPKWSVDRHLAERVSDEPMGRRVNFPTWSWTSMPTEVFNDGYGGQSVFGAYLDGISKETNPNHASVRFWVMLGGNYMPLNDVVSHREKLIPEGKDSQRLLVEGNLVRLCREYGKGHRVHDCQHLDLVFFATLDMEPYPAKKCQEVLVEDALVLINWTDSQRQTQRRFVMMLLEWVEEGVAERRGLVSNYRAEYSAEILNQIPTARKTFILK
ncbi:heterokaryon incompatibility protein-domain-containing protein [Dactylonectria macrodidyma]|uniref:Heterokaryon incompatibility protein-domain-containing protein n=1 Tax=Dactylonectria macrodidyma TaxID=307937 RepID=A0A9P9FUF2_9HYPO|nr:heterokaryon incompatibility protein-domain-containing protein [Dactylonectria macrodidyma]